MTTFAGNDDVGGEASAMLELQLPAGRPNRARAWTSVVLGGVIFLAGLACGAAAMQAFSPPARLVSWNDLLERVAQRMQADLDLTEKQQAGLQQIVRDHQPKLDHIRANTIREMRAELQQVIEETAAILSPEQARRFRAAVQPRLDKHFPSESEVDAKPIPNEMSN